jgi:hypothetical protein
MMMSLGFLAIQKSGHLSDNLTLLNAFTYSRLAVMLARDGMLLWLLYGVAFGDAAAPIEVPQPGAAPTRNRDLLIGGIWLSAGLLITIVSFGVASQAGGGRYIISVGPIVYGVMRIVRGLNREA